MRATFVAVLVLFLVNSSLLLIQNNTLRVAQVEREAPDKNLRGLPRAGNSLTDVTGMKTSQKYMETRNWPEPISDFNTGADLQQEPVVPYGCTVGDGYIKADLQRPVLDTDCPQ